MLAKLSFRSTLRTLLIAALFLGVSCSTQKQELHAPDHRFDYRAAPFSSDYAKKVQDTGPKEAPRLPWEIWQFDADLNGAQLNNPLITKIDQQVRYGDRQQAAAEYAKLLSSGRAKILTPAEIEAVTLRLASTELALKRPEAALVTLSRYFASKGIDAEQVDGRFSLLFAYAYARHGDLSQSLAWFGRLNSVAAARGVPGFSATPGVAADGVRLVLRTVPSAQLVTLRDEWANDVFLRVLIGEEYRRRSMAGNVEPRADEFDYILGLNERGEARWLLASDAVFDGGANVVGVLLPLSGRFANLGESLRRGIEMAFESSIAGVTPEGHPKVEFVDSSEDPLEAVARVRELIQEKGAAAIIGPLLADQVEPVLGATRAFRVPLLSLSRGAKPRAGDLLFRLAPTAESQVDSLMVRAGDPLKITRYGLVYPDEPAAVELAQAFQQALLLRGLAVSYEARYSRGDVDRLLVIAQEIEQQNVEAIFIPDQVQTVSRFISNFTPTKRERTIFLGPLAWDDERELSNSRSAMDGAVFVTPFARSSSNPDIQNFIEGFKLRYGKEPDFLAAQGFDAATLMLAGFGYHSGADVSVAEALRSLGKYSGLTGTITVDSDGEMRREFKVVQFLDGNQIELSELIDRGFVQPFEAVESAQAATDENSSFVFRGNERVDEQN